MKQVEEYKARAEEALQLAKRARPEQRAAIEQMADTWKKLAKARAAQIKAEAKSKKRP